MRYSGKDKRKETGRRRNRQAAACVFVVGKPEYLKTAWDFIGPSGSRKYVRDVVYPFKAYKKYAGYGAACCLRE